MFLPEEWTNDPARCKKVGIPEERLAYRTKPELGLEIVRRQRQDGTRFDYVLADGLYGHSGSFCRALADEGEIFLFHVHCDQRIYLEDPRPEIPARQSGRGRPPTKPRAQIEPVRVDTVFSELSGKDFERLEVRKTTTGVLEVEAYRRQVWVWDGEEDTARRRILYIRKQPDSNEEIKYCLTNAPQDTPLLALARMEAQRFFVEHAFEEAKSEVGMAEYQVRGWLAWHHHMAMVIMALLFTTKQRMLHQEVYPLMSCHDIKVFLAYFLPNRQTNVREILRQMEVRHQKRKAATRNAVRRKKTKVDSKFGAN